MPLVNEHFAKLSGNYLFPEIERRVEAHLAAHPEARTRLVRAGIGDVTEPLPPACVEALHAAAEELAHRETFRGYGPSTGHAFVREAIAAGEYAGTPVHPDEIFLSDGSKGDAGHALELFAPGNRAAIVDPVYPVYIDTNIMAGRTGPRGADGFPQGLVRLQATAECGFVPAPPVERVDLVYLCFPNNPTGAMIDRPALAAWVEFALANEAIILYDGAYADYVSDPALPRTIYEIPGADRCAIEFRSLSKSAGFTGVRCGWTVCPRALCARTATGEVVPLHPLWSRRWATRSNGVSWPVQRAAAAAYSPQGREQVRGLVSFYMENARHLRSGVEAAGLEAWGGEHAPYVWVRCPQGLSSWAFFDRLLAEAAIVSTPGSGFGPGGEGFVRISAFNSRANIEAVVTRLAAMSMATASA
jgi:LL-diaminopimelate aminotransferase